MFAGVSRLLFQISQVLRLRERKWKPGLTFYIGIPLAFAVALGWLGAGMMASEFSRPVAILYWFGAALLAVRLPLDLLNYLVSYLVPRGRVPLAVICLMAGLLQAFVALPVLHYWQQLFLLLLPDGRNIPIVPLFITNFETYVRIVSGNAVIIAFWVIENYFFDRYLNYPRFRWATGYKAEEQIDNNRLLFGDEHADDGNDASTPSAASIPFVQDLPENVRGSIKHIQAEDHYIRVSTTQGGALIRYRFRDALRELSNMPGIRVHRSHWVLLDAIKWLEFEDNRYWLNLDDGTRAPVSQRYVEMVKAKGFQTTPRG